MGWGPCETTQRTSSFSHCCTAHRPLTQITQLLAATIHALSQNGYGPEQQLSADTIDRPLQRGRHLLTRYNPHRRLGRQVAPPLFLTPFLSSPLGSSTLAHPVPDISLLSSFLAERV